MDLSRCDGNNDSVRGLRKRYVAAIIAAAVAVAGAFALAVPDLRDGLATLALKAVLKARGGFALRSGALRISSDRIDVAKLEIDDADGKPAITADRIVATIEPGAWVGRTNRLYGLKSIDVARLSLHVVRLVDGSYNFSRLLGHRVNAGTSATPLRVSINVRDGTVEFRNPTSPSPAGRRFTIEAIDVGGSINQGGISKLAARGTFNAHGFVEPVTADAYENDPGRFAVATLRANALPIGPVENGLLSSTAFDVQDGIAKDVEIRAFAIDYDPAAGPNWQLSGKCRVAQAAFRVLPLVRPVSGVNGLLTLHGGVLGTRELSGVLEGMPIVMRGGIVFSGGVRLAISVTGRQALERLKHAFAFSSKLDVRGPVDIAAGIEGPPSDVHVTGMYRSANTIAYTGFPLTNVSGTLYYASGHISFPTATATYDRGIVFADGDIDLSAVDNATMIDAVATMPAQRLPFAANLNPTGTARALVEFDGPLAAIRGMGYAEVVGGNGATARTAIYAGPDRFAVGPALLIDANGGEVMLRGAIDRKGPVRHIDGNIIARRASLHLIAAARSLPGLNDASPIALPDVSGTIGGTVVVVGDERAPNVFVNAASDGLIVNGTPLGHVAILASGNAGRVRIARLSISGENLDVNATGDASVRPRNGVYAAVLRGDARANLGALGSVSSSAHIKGSASGTFLAALSDGRWIVSMRGSGADTSVAGIAVRSVDASIGGGGGRGTDIYAASAALSGGSVSGLGMVSGGSRSDGDLYVWTDGIELKSLAALGVQVDRGRAIASARIRGSLVAPQISGAASVVGAGIGGQPFSGDVDVTYSGDRLVASDGRVAIGGGFAQVSGSVSGLGPGMPRSGAPIALTATMREGDLGALAGRYLPKEIALAGTVAATLNASGTLGAPRVDGYIDADSGTLQGVAFENLQGEVHASSGAVRVNGGSVGVQSSHFNFSGSLSRAALHLRASSARVVLSDFNDFFEGYDTFEGAGHGDVAFESTRTGVLASGHVGVANASVVGFPLGTLDADFSSRGKQVLAHVRQNGDAGSSDLKGSVTFGLPRSALPNFAQARYDVRGSVRSVDVGRITPLIGRESIGLTGLLDVDGSVRGTLRAPAGHAAFNLRNGHLGKIPIDQASGSIDTDGTNIALKNVAVALPFAHVSGDGSLGPGKRVAASFGVDASDLGAVFALLGRPGVASGTALATVTVSGTTVSPRVATSIVSGRGTAFGIGFDRLSGKVSYGPGEIDIADTELDFTGGRGILSIGGTLPLSLEPFGLGPKEKAVDITVSAKAVQLSALDSLTSPYATLGGVLDAQARVSGTAGRPQVTGSARLREANVSSSLESVPAEHVNADLALARDTLTLQRLAGNLGRGTFAGTGAVHIVPAAGLLSVAGLQYWTRLDVHGAQIDVPGWGSGSVDGTLRLTKSGAVPFLSGDVTLNDGTVPFSAIYRLASGYGGAPAPPSGPVPGVPELRPGHIIVYGGNIFPGGGPYVLNAASVTAAASSRTRLPSIDLALVNRAGRNVRVRGGAIDLTASGQLTIGGNLNAPTLAGEFTSTRGQIGYFDTNFRLVRGAVTFDPTEGLLPTLDVKAVTNLAGAEITLVVTGRVDNLQTDLSSRPTMTRDEIVATLLHAPVVQSVIGGNLASAQNQIYTEAQSYFNAQLSRSLLFPVESLLAQTFNVEQISLIYDVQGRVDVEVRKAITPTVSAIYRSSLNIPVTQTAGVAYSVRDYADLEILQTSAASGLQQTVLNLRLTFH